MSLLLLALAHSALFPCELGFLQPHDVHCSWTVICGDSLWPRLNEPSSEEDMSCFCRALKAPPAGTILDQAPVGRQICSNDFLGIIFSLFIFLAFSSSRQSALPSVPWGWGRSCSPILSRSVLSNPLSGRGKALNHSTCRSLWCEYSHCGRFQAAGKKSDT